MKRLLSLILAVLVLLIFSGCGANATDIQTSTSPAVTNANAEQAYETAKAEAQPVDITERTYSLKELNIDFELLKSIIETQHPMLYTDKEELDELFESQYKLIHDGMTEIEFYRVLSPIVAKLNCGHTRLAISEAYEEHIKSDGNLLPLMVKVIGDKAYLYKNLFSSRIPEGSEIVRINGMDIDEMIGIFLDNITADGKNLTMKYYIMMNWFSDMYFNCIGESEFFNVEYLDASTGNILTEAIPAATKDEIDKQVYNVNISNDSNYDKPYYCAFKGDYAVLRIKTLAFYDSDSSEIFNSYIDQFFYRIAEENTPNLIIDLRDNWGGDPSCTAHVLSYLIDEPVPYFTKDAEYYLELKKPIEPAKNNYSGNIYVLINGASFSSAGHLCALLKYYNIATFLGEESGGSYLCSDSSRDIRLVNTGLRFHYSTAPWEVVVSGLTPGQGIIPDCIITPTINDYLNNKDVVMEAAITLIEAQ